MQRPTYEEYPEWFRETHGSDWFDSRYENLYNTNSAAARSAIQAHSFYRELEKCLATIALSYNADAPHQLLTHGVSTHLLAKPFASVVNKSFRHNIMRNDRFPDSPASGWCLPENPFQHLNDAVRGMIVCRYIDGPAIVVSGLDNLAKSLNLKSKYSSRQNDQGYYAYHFYVDVPVQMTSLQWHTFDADVKLELQVTTQLQEVLKDLTHTFYEELRIAPNSSQDWKWKYDTPRFKGSYIGHTLHLIEGIIVQLKKEVARPERGDPDR